MGKKVCFSKQLSKEEIILERTNQNCGTRTSREAAGHKTKPNLPSYQLPATLFDARSPWTITDTPKSTPLMALSAEYTDFFPLRAGLYSWPKSSVWRTYCFYHCWPLWIQSSLCCYWCFWSRLLRGCWYSRPTWALWTPPSPARPYLMMHHAASDKEEQVKQENHRSSVTFLLWFSYTSASPRTLLNRLKPESKSCLWFSCTF